MGVSQRVSQRDPDLQQLLIREGILRHELRESAAVDELGDEIERVLIHIRLVQRDDRRMRQTRRGKRLARCALAGPRCATESVGGGRARRERYPLERDLTVQQLVIRPPDHTEPPSAEAFERAVAAVQQLVGASALTDDALRGASWSSGRARPSGFGGASEPLDAIGSRRSVGPREMLLDEGLRRVHQVARSPP